MKQYIGIPFTNGEPSFNGCNCITLVELIYKNELGIDIPKIRVLSENTRRVFVEYLQQIENNWLEVKEPEQYDVIAMARDIKHPRMIQHFGIYLGDGKVLHSLENIGSHIDTLENLKYFTKGFYRWQ